MNRLFKFTRIILALMFTLGVIGFSASTAFAAPPERLTWSASFSFEDDVTCSGPVSINPSVTVQQTDFYDKNGVLTTRLLHWNEQDTFIANGVTLVGDMFQFSEHIQYDSTGTVISDWADGVAERIPLPNGGLVFISAGRIDWLNHSGFALSADIGNPGDVAAFCAAFGQ